MLNGNLARIYNVHAPSAGLLVQRVAHGSPAERLGLRGGELAVIVAGAEELIAGGDIVLAVDGIALGAEDAYEQIRKRMIEIRERDGQLRVTVSRAGVMVDLTAVIDF